MAVSIQHSARGDLVVELIPPSGGTPLTLHDREGGTDNGLQRIYTSRTTVSLDSLSGTPARGDWVLTVGDYQGGTDSGRLDAWGLGFGPRTPARVVAGASRVVTARLVGVVTGLGSPALVSGEVVSVNTLRYGGEGMLAAPFEFSAETTAVDVTLTASVNATGGALLAYTRNLPDKVAVGLATLPVEIVPREFALRFTPPEIGILPGEEQTVDFCL